MEKLLATLAAFGLGIALCSGAWAQDTKGGTGNQGQNQNQGRDQDKDKDRSDMQTVRGVVAGVTAEGELAIDYRTNRVVLVQAAYLTVVGSPARGQEGASTSSPKPGDPNRQDKEQARDEDSSKPRDNVYIVWISPRTKIYEASGDPGKSDQKQEASLDALDVGERVEIQLSRREKSEAGAEANQVEPNQTDQMRRKHGRERIVYGDATAITILPSKGEDKSSSGSRDSSKGDPANPNRDK